MDVEAGLPMPIPRRRLRAPEEILNSRVDEEETPEEPTMTRREEVEEIEEAPPPQPYRAATSARPRIPLPADIKTAFQIPETPETIRSPTERSSSSRSPTDGRTAPFWASGYSSPPQRAPWDFSNSEPLSPTEQRPQPRRRLSQWLAEDPDIRMVAEEEERKQRQRLEREATIIVEEEDSARNALSPEAPSSRRGSATDIQPFAPAAAAEQKNSEPAARPKRRESIKVHLQRIKQKAEKVLEEVHDRLVDSGDHPSSGQVAPAVEEPITSPKSEDQGLTSPVSPPSEPVAEPEMLEKPASPTPSQSSRRTISSAELKDKMRMKIRKQAEKVVERTRDSIQLTRRLQRKPTFRQNSEALSPEQLNTDDAQIQRALQIGSRFTKKQESQLHSEEKQLQFITGRDPKTIYTSAHKKHAAVQYFGARAAKELPEELFISIPMEEKRDLEAGNVVGIRPELRGIGMNLSKMSRRVKSRTLLQEGQLRNVKDLVEKQPFTFSTVTPEYPLYQYTPAIQWTEAMKRVNRKFVQLDVAIGQLVFNYHWLATEEDALAMRIREEAEIHLEAARSVITAIQEIGDEHERAEKTEIPVDPDKVASAANRAETSHRLYRKATRDIVRYSAQLSETRNRQKYSTNPLDCRHLRIPAGPVQDDQFELPDFFLISNDHPTSPEAMLPPEEKARLAAFQRVEIQVVVHFNDIIVHRTPPRPLQSDFCVDLAELYNLEIYTPPESITLTILERFNKGEYREIAVVGLPVPDPGMITDDPEIPNLKPSFATDERINGYCGSLGANLDQSSSLISGSIMAKTTWATRFPLPITHSLAQTAKNEPFHLFPPCMQLVTEEEFHSDIRLDILADRYEKRLWDKPLYRGIPMNTSEIDASLLQLSEGRNTTLRRRGRGILDSHRQSSMAYAAMIRKELLDRFRRSDASKSYSDLVREDPIPSLFGAFSSLFGPVDQSRKLKPMRQPAPRVMMTSNVQLLVNIQSAIDLPVRDSGLLQPFVQVSFQEQNGQTGTVNGANPSWQHSLIFPVRRENESSDLKNVMDTVEIAIYDQSVSTLPKDDRIPNAVHEQTTQRFIASVRIPFSTILSRGNIEGQLRLQLPLFLLGYKLTEKPCYIRVLVALNPPVAVPRLRPPRLNGSFEPATVEAQCRQWETVCSSGPERSGRRYVSLVSDTHGRRVLATRFLRPARLPPRWHKSNVKGSVAEALRAAALIPFASDPIMFPGISDVWTSLQQILQLCCGDEEEHGVLLCCWLMALDVEARLVLGTALPEGDKAAFVYVKHPEISCLLNPTDGNMYSLDDGLCPLLSVGTVITPDNIYGNVQPNDHPSQISWDFTKPHLWHPLWLKPQTTTQNLPNENLEYPELPEEVVSELRSTIEREVRVRFDTNRPYGVPQWNLLASRALREILQEFEAGRPPDVSDKLSRLRESFAVSASAVRIPFESLETTVTHVLRLLYHVDASPQVQFAVAVHVEPLFCHIASISIGVAAMTPKT